MQYVRAVGQIGVLTLLTRISGLGRDVVICQVFGVGLVAAAFFVAFRIPNLLRRLVGEGATAAAFVPVITEYLSQRFPADALYMIRALLGTGLGLLLVLTGIGMLFLPIPLPVCLLLDQPAKSSHSLLV